MNNIIKSRIEYFNKNIILQTNDRTMYCNLINEYSEYLKFNEQYCISEELIKFKVVKDTSLYKKYLEKLINHPRPKFKNIYIRVRRENVIIIDKEKKEVTMIYDTYTDEKLQHIEEIILGILGKLIENDKYFFIHAACVSKNGKGIVLVGDKNIGKTSLMLEFIQNSFDLVNNSQLGIKGNQGVSIPARIGIRFESLYNGVIKEKYTDQIKKTIDYSYIIGRNNKLDPKQKFNLTVKEIREIFKIKTISETEIKAIIEPHYLPGQEKIKIQEMSREELINKLIENKRSGIYNSVNYMENLFDNNGNLKLLGLIQKTNIKGYKIFQNQSNEKELMEYIQEILNDEQMIKNRRI